LLGLQEVFLDLVVSLFDELLSVAAFPALEF